MNINNLPSLPESLTDSLPAGTAAGQGNSHAENVRALGKALESGNLQGASQAYAAIQQRIERVTQASNTQESEAAAKRLETFRELGAALQDGNLGQATQAYRQWRRGSTPSAANPLASQNPPENLSQEASTAASQAAAPAGSQASSLTPSREALLEAPPQKRHFFPRMVSPGVGGSLGTTIDIKV